METRTGKNGGSMVEKTIAGSYQKKGETRSIIASTPGLDRDGERITTSAWKNSLPRYLAKNPVILWGHDYSVPPVGKAISGKITDGALILDVVFAPTKEGQDVKTLYDGGFLNSFSVGFIPTNATAGNNGEKTYTECELLEVSCVTVPANPDAVMLRGLSPVLRKAFTQGDQKEEKIMEEMITYDEHLRIKKEAVDEARRMEKCYKAQGDGFNSISVGTPEKVQGINLRKTMDLMNQNMKARGADDYLKASPERAEAVAVFWIDKMKEAYRQKSNELVTTTTTLGGNLTPLEQEGAIMDYMRHTSVALQDATVVPMKSDIATVPVAGTAPAITIEANELTITQATPTFNLATLTSKRHSGRIPVSWELQMDEDASLVAYLADKFYEDLGKTIDSTVFFGAPTLVDGSSIYSNYGASTVLASAAFSSILASNIYTTVGKLTPNKRSGAKWYMQYSVFWDNVASKLNGTTSPIYDPISNKMMGHEVRELWTGPSSGAGVVMGIFGNLRSFLVGSRLMNTQLMKIDSPNGYSDFVFFTRLAYANPLPAAFVAIKAA
jgi:uncharacterized protein